MTPADAARARRAAGALVGLLDEGFAPDFTDGPEPWLAAAEAWVQGRALPQVPPPARGGGPVARLARRVRRGPMLGPR